MSRAVPLLPLWPFMAGSRVNFTLLYLRDEAENIKLWDITVCLGTPLMHEGFEGFVC